MKKFIVITLLIAFCCVFIAPQKARAEGAAEGALIGAAIGVVIAIILWAVSPTGENPQKEKSSVKENKLTGSYTFVPNNQSNSLPNFTKVEQQAVPLYSFKVEF